MNPVAVALLFILGSMAVLLDLGVFSRTGRLLTLPAALAWSTFWFAIALFFTGLVYLVYEPDLAGAASPGAGEFGGQQAALQFFSGYLIQKSIAVANILAVAMIFTRLRVPLISQQRALLWGLAGAAIFRAAAVLAGSLVFLRIDWAAGAFAVVLMLSAIRVFVARPERIVPERNLAVLLARRRFPEAADDGTGRLLVRADEGPVATPLLTALILILTASAMFAVDAVPGILGVTRDPFLIFTATLFALPGGRAMYFALAPFIDRLRYLQLSLAVLLGCVGTRLLSGPAWPVDDLTFLSVVGIILATGVLLSVLFGPRMAPGLSPMLEGIEEIVWISYRQARRLVVLLLGVTVMLTGVVMIVAPGPAFVVIPLGIAILAIEFTWARRWLGRLREGFGEVEARLSRRIRGMNRPGGARPPEEGRGSGAEEP